MKMTLSGTHYTVDPMQDECVLAGRKDRADVAYYRHEDRQGARFYVYRPAQQAYGETLRLLCEEVTAQEIQEAVTERARYEPLQEYADLARLQQLGFRLP